jgi:hypothetical protein
MMQHERSARREHWRTAAVFLIEERQDPMSNADQTGGKPAKDKRDREAERRAREKALDKALEDTFPASDPVAPAEPAPSRD